jgi:tRNA A37 threonylcarbamoyladenosine dehydratase
MTQKTLYSSSLQPMTEAELDDYKLHRRFDRFGRLVGDRQMKRLADAHIMILGLGGVGSFAAESIARSGVGRITLIDFDEICVTNFNRQLHALQGQIGKAKAQVMAERLRQVNPRARFEPIPLFYNAEHADEIFRERPDFVIDAIDHVTSKCHLLDYCKKRGIPIVCSTGSAGRLDPAQIKVGDLAETSIDPLARAVRGILRDKYGYPTGKKTVFGIPAVFSTEPHTDPVELHYDQGKGFRCVCPQGDNPYFTCDNRNVILGNASFVTGAFGLFCASVAVRHLLGQPLQLSVSM